MLYSILSLSNSIFSLAVNPSPTVIPHAEETVDPATLYPDNPISLSGCRGQVTQFSLYIRAKEDMPSVTVSTNNLTSSEDGSTIEATSLVPRIVKWRYTSAPGDIGFSVTSNNRTTPTYQADLLVNDDALVTTSGGITSLRTTTVAGVTSYKDISGLESSTNTPDVEIRPKDSAVLLPTSIAVGTNKEYWFTVTIPDSSTSGIYTGSVTITYGVETLEVPIYLEVYTFDLEVSGIEQAIYYRGVTDSARTESTAYASSEVKTPAQTAAEPKNMKEHGIDYPTLYIVPDSNADILVELNLRSASGLPTDKLYYPGIPDISVTTSVDANGDPIYMTDNLQYFHPGLQAGAFAGADIYYYGFDEALLPYLTGEVAGFDRVHAFDSTAKVFIANNISDAPTLTNLNVDVVVDSGQVSTARLAQWKALGYYTPKVFSYDNPQIGTTDPLVYRQRYGLLLWRNNYDGVMNYAYQHGFGTNPWNSLQSYDDVFSYIDHNFTMPTVDGVIDRLSWEGYREGNTDVKYLRTLEVLVSQFPTNGESVSAKAWLDGLTVTNVDQYTVDSSIDIDDIRDICITYIKKLKLL